MNLVFNGSHHLTFGGVFKYICPGVEGLSETSLTPHFKQREKSTVDDIPTYLPGAGIIFLAADKWTLPTKLTFLAIVANWISDSWQIEDVLIWFEEIKASHTRGNMALIINHFRPDPGFRIEFRVSLVFVTGPRF